MKFLLLLLLLLFPVSIMAQAPVISDLTHTPSLAACAHIKWKTDGLATQRVFYDTTSHPSDTDGSQYTFSTTNDTLADTSNQYRLLEYLTPNTTYFYKVRSSNGSGATFSSEQSFTTAVNSVRTSNLLIIRVNFPNDLTSGPSDATINSQMQEVADAMNIQSFGQSQVTWDIVPGTLTAPQTTTFYKNLESVSNLRRAEQLAIDVSALAAGAGFNTANYFQYVIWVPQGYDWANGGFFTGVNGTSQMHLGIFSANYLVWANMILAGLGGGGRANAWITNDSTVFGSAGAPDPGGIANPYDALGSAEQQVTPLNIKHKSGTGFLLPSFIQTVTTNGTYRIYAHDTTTTLDGSRKYGIRMAGYQGTQYWIEFRESDPPMGVIIDWGGLMFLDMNPGSPLSDGHLTVGNTFTDPDGRTVTFTSSGGTTPKFVDLTIGGLAAAPSNGSGLRGNSKVRGKTIIR